MMNKSSSWSKWGESKKRKLRKTCKFNENKGEIYTFCGNRGNMQWLGGDGRPGCHSCNNGAIVLSGDVLQPGHVPSNKTCDDACSSHSTCENSTRASCMWCGNQAQWVESNAYVSSFPYGQCMEWTTVDTKCPGQCCLKCG